MLTGVQVVVEFFIIENGDDGRRLQKMKMEGDFGKKCCREVGVKKLVVVVL
jgi:hypothetical protein